MPRTRLSKTALRSFSFDEPHAQGHGQRGLAPGRVGSGPAAEVFRVEGGFDRARELFEPRGVRRPAQNVRHARQELQVVVVDRGRGEPERCELGRPGRIRPQVVPVPETLVQEMPARLTAEVLGIARHHRVGALHGAPVAVPFVDQPGQDDARASPLGRVAESPLEGDELRRDVGDEAVLELGLDHVVHELVVEIVDVEIVLDGRAHEVGLLEPTQLFPVGTVGDDAGQVAPDRPEDQPVDPVEELVRALEAARFGRRVPGVEKTDVENLGRAPSPPLPAGAAPSTCA